MQVLGMTIEANEKVYQITRESDEGAALVRVAWPDGTSCLNRGITSREACFDLALRIAHHAYGESRRGTVNATPSMLSEITNVVARIAGC